MVTTAVRTWYLPRMHGTVLLVKSSTRYTTSRRLVVVNTIVPGIFSNSHKIFTKQLILLISFFPADYGGT